MACCGVRGRHGKATSAALVLSFKINAMLWGFFVGSVNNISFRGRLIK